MFTFSDNRTDELIRILRAHPEGATLVDIAMRLKPVVPERKLQRWLARLISARLVTRHGNARNVRYFAGTGRVALPVKKRAPKAPPPAPDPAPTFPTRLSPEYQRLFDTVAAKIIRMGLVDNDAGYILARASLEHFGMDDQETMNAFVRAGMAEFDALDRDTALAKYDITRENWDDWRKSWCLNRDLPREKG